MEMKAMMEQIHPPPALPGEEFDLTRKTEQDTPAGRIKKVTRTNIRR